MRFDREKYGPWALVAGASEGTGTAFARQLAAAGLNLVLVARNAERLEELAQELRQEHGVEVRPVPLDLSRPDRLAVIGSATDDVEVGLMIYNVGSSYGSDSFLEDPLESSLQTIQLNPAGQVSLAHHFGKRMAARGRGGLVFLGSIAGCAGTATLTVYSAVKAFTQTLAEGLWAELQPLGVDVTCMVLGATDTPARDRSGVKDLPGQVVDLPEDVVRLCLANIANGPVVLPSHLEEGFQQVRTMPRRQAAETMRDMIINLKE